MSIKRNFRVTVEVIEWHESNGPYDYADKSKSFYPCDGSWIQIYQQTFEDTIRLKAIEAALSKGSEL